MNILYVCTGNICRSPMAEYYTKHLVKTRGLTFITTFSAGIHACVGSSASGNSLTAMQELGIDISDHQGKQLTSYMVTVSDWIFVMEQRQKEIIGKNSPKIMLLTEFYEPEPAIDISDPYGSDLSSYRIARDIIMESIDTFIDRITTSNNEEISIDNIPPLF